MRILDRLKYVKSRLIDMILSERFESEKEFLKALLFKDQEKDLTIVLGPLKGTRMSINPRRQLSLLVGGYERDFTYRIIKLLDGCKVAYDIGAYMGYYSLLMEKYMGKDSVVYAFEPHPTACEKIEYNLSINKVTNVFLFRKAISDSNSTASLCLGESWSSIVWDHGVDTISVDTVTLDSLVNDGKIQPPDLIKIDIEGAEVKALEGGLETISQFQPKLAVELHASSLAEMVLKRLTNLGYTIQAVDSRSSLPSKDSKYIYAVPKR